MIEFSHVQKKYGKNIVLDKVNFTIERGETVAIVGFSGAGKSVCLRHMIRLTGPDHGSILIDGDAVRETQSDGDASDAFTIWRALSRGSIDSMDESI